MKKQIKIMLRRRLALLLAVMTMLSMSIATFGEEYDGSNAENIIPVGQEDTPAVDTVTTDGTTTVTDITREVWDTDGGEGWSKTETSVTTDADGNVIGESVHVTGSETTAESSGSQFTEPGVGGVSVTVKPGETSENTADADTILKSLMPDTSGVDWNENEDGSYSKTETNEDGACVTITVAPVTDDNGKVIGYSRETVTTTEETTSTSFETPEAGVKENADGSRTTVTVERDENGTVIGYTEITEMSGENGTVVSRVTKMVRDFGTTTTTTTTTTKTQTVEPDTSASVTVEMGLVTEGDSHGALHTNGLEITDTPAPDNDLLAPTGDEGIVNLDDLEDDDLIFVSGIGLVSKYNLTIMWTQNKNGGWQKYSKGWPVRQCIVKDADGNEHPVYCADMSVVTENGTIYYLENTEDADYYTNPNNNAKDPDGGMHLRVIATNGYWGTAEGTGSLSELIDKLLQAKTDGDPALASVSEEQIRALTAGQAMTATQAAIWKYGNSLSVNPFVLANGSLQMAAYENSKLEYDPVTGTITRTTTEYDQATGKTTITTEETKVFLPEGADITIERDPETQEITKITIPQYYPAYIKLLPDGWLNNPSHSLVAGHSKNSDEVQLIEAVYKYLTTLEEEDKTTDLIQPSDIVEAVTNVRAAVGKDEEDRDVYEADVSFVLTVEQSRLNGDLLVRVYDANTGELITTRRVAGDDSKDDPAIGKAIAAVSDDGKSTTYTIDGLRLSNGQSIRINLVGSQEVKKGAYLITATNGYKDHQTFVGVEEGSREVDLNFTLTLNIEPGVINSMESTRIERTWDERRETLYSYYTLDLPDNPGPDPDPDPEPAPDPDPDPDPEPTPEPPVPDEPVPLTDFPDEDVPLAETPGEILVELLDEDVPLAEMPDGDFVDIFDEDVPLASVPETGDISIMWYVTIFLAACTLTVLILNRREENKTD